MTRVPRTSQEVAEAYDQLTPHQQAVFLAAVAIMEEKPGALDGIAPAILAEARALLDAAEEGAPCVR